MSHQAPPADASKARAPRTAVPVTPQTRASSLTDLLGAVVRLLPLQMKDELALAKGHVAAKGKKAGIGAGMFGGILLLPQYLQIVLGFGPLEAGLASLPMTAVIMVAAPLLTKALPAVAARASRVPGPNPTSSSVSSMAGSASSPTPCGKCGVQMVTPVRGQGCMCRRASLPCTGSSMKKTGRVRAKRDMRCCGRWNTPPHRRCEKQ